jgi:ribosomal protein S18 acetylase RimI-like enzyme
MTSKQLAAYRATMVESYAAALMRDAGLRADEAHRKAAADAQATWPESAPPAGHVLAVLEVDGRGVGRVWFGPRTDRPALFIYDVEIDDEHRRRGIARAALALLEDEARARDLDSVELNVLGGNAAARALYRSAGYTEVAITMRKLV